MRDILRTIPPGGSCELDVEISAHQEGLCEREVVFYAAAPHLVEKTLRFRAVGKPKE